MKSITVTEQSLHAILIVGKAKQHKQPYRCRFLLSSGFQPGVVTQEEPWNIFGGVTSGYIMYCTQLYYIFFILVLYGSR